MNVWPASRTKPQHCVRLVEVILNTGTSSTCIPLPFQLYINIYTHTHTRIYIPTNGHPNSCREITHRHRPTTCQAKLFHQQSWTCVCLSVCFFFFFFFIPSKKCSICKAGKWRREQRKKGGKTKYRLFNASTSIISPSLSRLLQRFRSALRKLALKTQMWLLLATYTQSASAWMGSAYYI